MRFVVLQSCVLVAVCFSTFARCAETAKDPAVDKAMIEPVGEGWTPIWSRESLTGWKAESEFWKLEKDGALHGYTPGFKEHHYAYTEKDYADFELHADFKLVGNNSGICIRTAPTSYDNVPGYQVDIGDGYWGCLWEEHGRGMVVQYPKDAAEKVVHKDDWNHYYVRAQGHHVEAWLNGTKTFDIDDEKGPLTGRLGFQLCHGVGKATDATFKNVVIRPIGR